MKDKVTINLKSNKTVEGTLVGSFGTNEIDVRVDAEGHSGTLIFSMDEICHISFPESPDWTRSAEPTTIEEIKTIIGETFKVAVFNQLTFISGFAGVIQDGPHFGCTIFFPFSAVRYRLQDRPIGQILEEQGLVSDDSVEKAIKTQQEIRGRLMGELLAESAQLSKEVIEKTLHESSPKGKHSRRRVGEILVEAGLVTREQVEKAFETQKEGKNLKIGELLVKQGIITEDQRLLALAKKFQLNYVDLETLSPSTDALGALSEGFVSRMQVFPLNFDGRKLVVATSEPTDTTISDSLRFSTSCAIELVVASPTQITQAIEKYYHAKKETIDDLLIAMDSAGQTVTIEEDVDEAQFIEPDSQIIALVNKILIDAYKKGASDIHFEPGSSKTPIQIRYRIDGECFIAHKISSSFKNAIISRIKIISGLDISERRRPQSGKFAIIVDKVKLEFRVEITPTAGNQEDAVLRLLTSAKPFPIDNMELMCYNIDRFKNLLKKPYGMILCVGPTGSGKTTTLHSAIGHINKPMRKIWTAEDPVEITQPGLRQVQVNAKIGLTFSEALRSFLRADPDVIMIGEMRDTETARIAVEASLTGHLVFSTLHTNSAPETAMRLIDMGIDAFYFSDALLAIIAQRLSRRLCEKCKKPLKLNQKKYDEIKEEFFHEAGRATNELPELAKVTFMGPTGCDDCRGTGYKGRIALHELLVATPVVKNTIKQSMDIQFLKNIALQEGMWTLKMDGIMKVLKGYTDMEQINKVCM